MKKYLILFSFLFVAGFMMGQKIKAYEYWVDDNVAGKVSTSITPVKYFHLQADLPLSSVTTGFHMLNVRFIDSTNSWSSILTQYFMKYPAGYSTSKQIVAYEYWVDDGYANTTYQTVSPASGYHLSENLSLSSVSNGFHLLNLRFKDNTGVWSGVVTQYFMKYPAGYAAAKQIAAYEYWIDDGFANKTYQTVSPASVYHLTENLNLASVSNGFHLLNLRFKDNTGAWSGVFTQYFTKFGQPVILPNTVVTYRFWFDNDPGTMETYTFPQPAQFVHWADTIEMPFLAIGQHVINYQFRDTNHIFSSVRTDTFNVTSCLPHGGRVISGLPSVCLGQTGVVYSIRKIKNAASYTWSVPAGATIIAGGNTHSITVDFSMTASPGDISVYATNACGNGNTLTFPIILYPATIAGEVTGGETIFFGMEASLNLEGSLGSVIKWQKRWNGGVWVDIDNTQTTYSEVPDTTGIWDYRAQVRNGTCSTLFSDFTTVTVQPVLVTMNFTLFLEGLFNPATNQMNKAQDVSGNKFPGTVADKIQFRLAKPANPFSVYYSVNDADLHQDGSCTITIPRAGYYYLVVRHRNSIETWSSAPVSLLPDPFSYDFSTAASQAYGDNQKEISEKWVIYGGDATQDGFVDGSDLAAVDNASTAVLQGYNPQDVNGDGIVDGSDMAMVDNNSTSVVQVKKP